jgi:hypothetical protein
MIHWSPPSIEGDLERKVSQIAKKDTFIVERDHDL